MKKILYSVLVALSASVAGHAITLDTGNPDRPFAVGVRLGANCSNLSNNCGSSMHNVASYDSKWGAGFVAGAVFDLNIKKYLVLQPGFFFETRSCDYRRVIIDKDEPRMENYDGGYTSSYFKIPIVMSFRLELAPSTEVQFDFGPYFQFGLGGSEKYDVYSLSAATPGGTVVDERKKGDYFGNDGFVRDYDWGFKMGVGMLLLKHYYLGVHYEAGCRNVLYPVEDSRRDVNGRNKAWDFTVGYVF